jgi:hypothetical protein
MLWGGAILPAKNCAHLGQKLTRVERLPARGNVQFDGDLLGSLAGADQFRKTTGRFA